MKGLLIRTPWIDLILVGAKTWELRGRRTNTRDRIALIRSGSGTVAGLADLVDVRGPLSRRELLATVALHRVPPAEMRGDGAAYPTIYAWVLENPVRFQRPVPYRHPPGAVIWVELGDIDLSLGG